MSSETMKYSLCPLVNFFPFRNQEFQAKIAIPTPVRFPLDYLNQLYTTHGGKIIYSSSLHRNICVHFLTN